MPGEDDVLRVVKVRTKDGEYVRPVAKLFKLEENNGDDGVAVEKINGDDGVAVEKINGDDGVAVDMINGDDGATSKKIDDNVHATRLVGGDDDHAGATATNDTNASVHDSSVTSMDGVQPADGSRSRRRRRRKPSSTRQYNLRGKDPSS